MKKWELREQLDIALDRIAWLERIVDDMIEDFADLERKVGYLTEDSNEFDGRIASLEAPVPSLPMIPHSYPYPWSQREPTPWNNNEWSY